MRELIRAFNGLVLAQLVRRGESRPLLDREGGNYADNVYPEMLLQICRDYPGLPDVRTMKVREIIFFYDGLRAELEQRTKAK